MTSYLSKQFDKTFSSEQDEFYLVFLEEKIVKIFLGYFSQQIKKNVLMMENNKIMGNDKTMGIDKIMGKDKILGNKIIFQISF